MTDKQFAAHWARKHRELVEQLKRLEQRRKEGWGYRRVLRKAHTVKAYRVRAHYAMVPVKT